MIINSVVDLRSWVAQQLQQLPDNEDVDLVVRFIRRKTEHPLYGMDWSYFLESIDCRNLAIQA